MYNCAICGMTSRPREPMVRHVVSRTINAKHPWTGKSVTRTEVACEVPVCHDCREALLCGNDLHAMHDFFRRQQGEFVSLPVIGRTEPTVKLPSVEVPVNASTERGTFTGADMPLKQLQRRFGGSVKISNNKH